MEERRINITAKRKPLDSDCKYEKKGRRPSWVQAHTSRLEGNKHKKLFIYRKLTIQRLCLSPVSVSMVKVWYWPLTVGWQSRPPKTEHLVSGRQHSRWSIPARSCSTATVSTNWASRATSVNLYKSYRYKRTTPS